MKGVHWSVWVALIVLIMIIVILSARKEGYAPARDENTQPPFTENVGNTAETSNNSPYIESTSNVVRMDNQTQIYKDMGGLDFQIQAGNPILNFIQGDPSSNVIYGDFVPNESDGGSARMYAISDQDMIVPETTNQMSNNCPRSAVILVDENRTLYPGTYSVNRSSYIMNIYPPLHIVVTGPDGVRDEMNYPSNESCPTMVKVSLNKEKLYDTIVLTTDTSSEKSNVNMNPSMETTMYSGYALDMNGNVINPIATKTTITKEAEAVSNIRYGFDQEGKPLSSSDNAQLYGFDIQGNLPPDSGQYIPTLTSPNIPFLGNQPGISASESPASATSPEATQ